MEIWHITLTSERESRLPLFRDEAGYLEALHRLGAVCAGCLALFALIAEHLHLVAIAARRAAGILARAAKLTLRPLVRTPLAVSDIRAVQNRFHMRRLLSYELEQPRRHGMPGHPALWIGSCLPELVGARRIPGLSLRIAEALPDFSLAGALSMVGIRETEIAPASVLDLRNAGAHRIKTAAAAALGTGPALRSGRPADELARRAVAVIGASSGIATAEVARALGVTPRAVQRLKHRPVDAPFLAAVARRITLEDTVQRSLASSPQRTGGPEHSAQPHPSRAANGASTSGWKGAAWR